MDQDPNPAHTHRGVPLKPGLHRRVAELDVREWTWPHFSAKELSCQCGRFCEGEYYHDPAFLDALEKLRDLMKAPIHVNSARRCIKHNAAVGGARASMHMRTLAVDLSLHGHDRAEFARAAVAAGFKGIGFGRSFVHLDRGIACAWSYSGAMPLWVAALGFNPVKHFARLQATSHRG